MYTPLTRGDFVRLFSGTSERGLSGFSESALSLIHDYLVQTKPSDHVVRLADIRRAIHECSTDDCADAFGDARSHTEYVTLHRSETKRTDLVFWRDWLAERTSLLGATPSTVVFAHW